MSGSNSIPDRQTFLEVARPGAVVPVRIEFTFDIDTAVTAYAKLRGGPFGFLLESVEGGERWARYSFLGAEPRAAWRLDGDQMRVWKPRAGWGEPTPTEDPFGELQTWISRWEPTACEGLPRFWGGVVGYLGYDMVRWLERLPNPPARDVEVPDACFLATDRVLILDNLFSRASAVRSVCIPSDESLDHEALGALYDAAVVSLEGWIGRLATPAPVQPLILDPEVEVEVKGNRTQGDFEAGVSRIREYITAGDAYQVVLSQRGEAPMAIDALDLYRALRMQNPSPYLFLIELDGMQLIGSSPEPLVRVEDGTVTTRPIAGTRRRGLDSGEDEQLAVELMEDEKERAEHLMLVDLGRNDVSRVAEPGTVRVPRFMQIERFSHVMHLVSEVTGTLRSECTAMDALRSCFPAGTLTGAPKVRAMEIIDELEPTRRGPYGGAAGYVAYGAESLDMAIVIRTILAVGDRAYAQAGAGVVYDSVPAREWEETREKARVLLRALAASQGPDPAE
jgi:anthranilate synthase component 1